MCLLFDQLGASVTGLEGSQGYWAFEKGKMMFQRDADLRAFISAPANIDELSTEQRRS